MGIISLDDSYCLKEIRMSKKKLMNKLVNEGGCIVSSADCEQIEIVDARSRGDFYVNTDGLGFVRRLPEWLRRHDPYCRQSSAKMLDDLTELELKKILDSALKLPLSEEAKEACRKFDALLDCTTPTANDYNTILD